MTKRLRCSRLSLLCLTLLTLAAPSRAFAQSGIAKINGESLYYEAVGQGTPLILIHGWSLNSRMWDAQVPALSKRFRVIRYDRRGFGKSSGNEDVSWDAVDLNALLDQLGVKKVHVLGLSQGARVAMQFARDYPERVASLVLHGPSPPEGFLPWSGADRTKFDEWTTLARERGMDAFRREWSAHPLMEIPPGHPRARTSLDEMLAAYRGGRFLSPKPPSGPVAPITMDDLRRISAPTLVLSGEREVPFLQIVARALAYYIPNARLVVVPGGGHMVNMIEPDRYNSAILKFLGSVNNK